MNSNLLSDGSCHGSAPSVLAKDPPTRPISSGRAGQQQRHPSSNFMNYWDLNIKYWATAIKRGKRGLRCRKIEITLYPELKLVYYPYWPVYYRGRRGEMRFAVMDGVNGRKESEEIVHSIRLGLVKKKEAPRRLEFSEGADSH